MKIFEVNISAGHNPDGKPASGSVGFFKESTQNRKIVKLLIKRSEKMKKLKKKNIIQFFDCTVNNAKDQDDHLKKTNALHNFRKIPLNVQIHFNCYNGNAQGSEILAKTTENTTLIRVSNYILQNLNDLGFKKRGIDLRKHLSFLNNVKNSIIVEVCFCDNKNDAEIYKQNKKAVAKAIYNGIIRGLSDE